MKHYACRGSNNTTDVEGLRQAMLNGSYFHPIPVSLSFGPFPELPQEVQEKLFSYLRSHPEQGPILLPNNWLRSVVLPGDGIWSTIKRQWMSAPWEYGCSPESLEITRAGRRNAIESWASWLSGIIVWGKGLEDSRIYPNTGCKLVKNKQGWYEFKTYENSDYAFSCWHE
jgi:hypothetical protein